MLSLVAIANVLVVVDDIVINCDTTLQAGWKYTFHEIDNDVAQVSPTTIFPIDGRSVVQMNISWSNKVQFLTNHCQSAYTTL